METCTAQVMGRWPKLCHLKDKRNNLIRRFKVIQVRAMKDFERYERNKGNKERWGMEIVGNYSPLNYSGTFRMMSNKLHAMWLLHCTQTDEWKAHILITSFLFSSAVFFSLFTCLLCFSLLFLSLFHLYFSCCIFSLSSFCLPSFKIN